MFSSDELIGVKPSEKYKFMIILSPTGPYYSTPMRIYVEEQYVRAVPGGVGYAKAAGNYGAAMFATAEAKVLDVFCDRAADAIETLISSGLEIAQSRYNQ
jgi:branched-subunit amino acid aminotransferase/4-amino-4-deoxychorismate lyase